MCVFLRSVAMRHSQYDAAMILTLNLATCITQDSQQDETATLARLGDTICTLCHAVQDMQKDNTKLLHKRKEKLN